MVYENYDIGEDLIELGTVVDQTKGPNGGLGDFIGLQDPVGISDD